MPLDADKFKAECKKWRDGKQTAVDTMRKVGMKRGRFYKNVRDMGI